MQVVKFKIISRIRKIFSVWIFVQIGFVFSANTGDIIITEFFYEKSGGNLPEYIEIFNNTESLIEIHGWKVEIDDTLFEIDGACDDSMVTSIEVYTNKSACNDAGYAWKPFSIESHDYAVILTKSGVLRSKDETTDDETTYCSSSHYSYYETPYNVCEMQIDNLFWKLDFLIYSGLSNTSGTIKIWDNSDALDPIDVVVYDMAADFPVDEDVLGRAAIFIIDPTSVNAFEKNDDGNNWRLSEHPSDFLWNGSSSDFGSPLSSNFITPTILIEGNSNANSDLTKNTVCSYTGTKMVCRPHNDGYPGGYAAIELIGTAIDYSYNTVSLDYLYWTFKKNNILVDSISKNDSVWHLNPLLPDTDLTSSIYTISLVTRNTDGFFGKTDTSFYIEEEVNIKPSVVKLTVNGQSPQSPQTIINISEETEYSLIAEVTDPELCSSINAPCNFDSLTFNSSSFDNTSPFLWTSDSIYLLSDKTSLINYLTSSRIDSLHGISANNNPDTLNFQFKVTDPFGLSDASNITIIINNDNEPPSLNSISDQILWEDSPIIFDLVTNDPDGDALTFSVDLDAGANYSINGNRLTILPKLHFNGVIEVTVNVTDGKLTDSQSFTITLNPINDQPSPFSIHPLYTYNYNGMDTTAFYVESDSLFYFRLPQEMNLSLDPLATLRFQWDKNDMLDPEMDPELNNGDSLHLFYRLEAILNDSIYIILKDSINHQHPDFLEDSLIYTEINVSDGFPYYLDIYEDYKNNESIFLDVNGEISYKWRVVAQNYLDDPLSNDPYRICSGWENTDFRIDLIQPEVSKLDIILNDMYPGFYDLLWSSTEAFLTDSTFLSIKEETNQFSAISMLNPRRITDNLFHFTGIIPMDLNSVTITFDLQIRDNAMNSGVRIDEVSFIKVSPDTASLLISPSNNVTISLQKNSVSEPVLIIITDENNNIANRKSNTELYQLTPTIHFYPNELILNKSGSIYFDISDYSSSEYEPWQLTIFEINDTESTSLTTNISEGMLTASIDKLGSYAVFMNLTLERPVPSKFELKMNYPNPFNPSTTFPIELPEESFVEVAIYNILGEKITVLSKGVKSSGYHNIHWHGTNQFGKQVSSGIYFVRVQFGQNIYHQKMMLLK